MSFFAWNNRRNGDVSCLQLFVLDLLPDFFSWQEQSQSKRPSCFFSSNNFRKTKTATAPLAAKIVQHYGPQQIRHNMLELSRIAKFRSKKNAILYHNHWPQKNSAEVMKDRQSINLILRTLLDPRLLLLDCDCELLPSCTKISPQTSLPKISVHSASRKSHRARSPTNFNYSSTLRLKIVKQKKGKPLGKPQTWPEHHAVLTWFCSEVGNLPHQGQMIKKGNKRRTWHKKENWKSNEGRRKD